MGYPSRMGKTETVALRARRPEMKASVCGAFLLIMGAVVAGIATPLQANVTSCIDIANNQLRLACYDRLFRGEIQPQQDVLDATVSAAEKSIAKRKSPSPTSDVDVNGRVVQVEKNLHNELLVELDNGQVWQQLSPRLMSINEGDEVIVKKARLGGYILSTSSGGSTRVKRKE